MHAIPRRVRCWTILMPLVAAAMIGAAQEAKGQGERTPATQSSQPERRGSTNLETAIFAGGCFWCMEAAFDPIDGVVETTSGYTGGKTKNPTYEAVKHGRTGHYESLKVTYDPQRVTFAELLDVFWHNIDPFDARGQFCDRGSQYRAAIFVADDAQRETAEESLEEVGSRTKKRIVTQILPASDFYDAEEYHQNYYQKNPVRYRYYRSTCGRDRRLREVWGAAAGH